MLSRQQNTRAVDGFQLNGDGNAMLDHLSFQRRWQMLPRKECVAAQCDRSISLRLRRVLVSMLKALAPT